MAEKLLSAKTCETASVATGEKLFADGGNLFLRVRPASKDWLFIYRLGDKRPKIGLGSYPDVTLSRAREKASELRQQLADGIDPKQERIRQEAEAVASKALQGALPQNIKELFELWERMELSRRKDQGAEVRRMFTKDVLPKLGNIPLAALRRAHITTVLDTVAERGANRVAGLLLADMRQMFKFAVNREIMPGDPSVGLVKKHWDGQSKERDRVLAEAELRQLFQQLPTSTLSATAQAAVKIMLSTCCRIGEIANARWADVDLENAEWTIPAANSKNAKAHTVSLPDFALTQFKALYERAREDAKRLDREMSAWVMPAKHHTGCVCTKSLAKIIGDRQRGDAKPMKGRTPFTDTLILPGGKWTPHDLRRTGATLMSALGVRPDVIEKCLNHTEQNRLVRIYQRNEMRPEMKAAWSLLGDRLEFLDNEGTGNVVLLRTREAA